MFFFVYYSFSTVNMYFFHYKNIILFFTESMKIHAHNNNTYKLKLPYSLTRQNFHQLHHFGEVLRSTFLDYILFALFSESQKRQKKFLIHSWMFKTELQHLGSTWTPPNVLPLLAIPPTTKFLLYLP